MRMTTRALVLAVMATAVAFGMTEVLSVDPVKESWSAFGDSVSQVVTLNVDTLKQVDVFIGFNEGDGAYNINVYSYSGGQVALAYGDHEAPDDGHRWLGKPGTLPVLIDISAVVGSVVTCPG